MNHHRWLKIVAGTASRIILTITVIRAGVIFTLDHHEDNITVLDVSDQTRIS